MKSWNIPQFWELKLVLAKNTIKIWKLEKINKHIRTNPPPSSSGNPITKRSWSDYWNYWRIMLSQEEKRYQWGNPLKFFSCYFQIVDMYTLWAVREPLVKFQLPYSYCLLLHILSIPLDSDKVSSQKDSCGFNSRQGKIYRLP